MRIRLLVVVSALMLSVGVSAGRSPAQEPQGKSLTPEDIIRAFAVKETEFFEAWKQYAYTQVATIRVVEKNGYETPNEKMLLVSEIVFDDDGRREVRLVERRGRLTSVRWTPEDEEVINNIQPFALTEKDLPLYEVKYEGKERVDELDTYVFSVEPKSTKGGRLYFEGRIWVDDQDLQIVRTFGKAVPQDRNNKFPKFETLRQIIDDEYWFPAWTHADETLSFGPDRIRIEETITYENYKRFGSKATIDFVPPPNPD